MLGFPYVVPSELFRIESQSIFPIETDDAYFCVSVQHLKERKMANVIVKPRIQGGLVSSSFIHPNSNMHHSLYKKAHHTHIPFYHVFLLECY